MVNRMVFNETSYFGRGSRNKLIDELKLRKYQKVLLVSDNNLVNNNVLEMIEKLLKEAGILYFTFTDIKINPTTKNVKDGLRLGEINRADVVVAVGGGSVIDTAKAIALIMSNPEHSEVVSLEGITETRNKALPLFVLPTTSGSGAEATIHFVITDEFKVKKMVCIDAHSIPICTIIDPDLMQSMSQSLLATTGIDALAHAMEGYITKAGWLVPDMFNINAMVLIYKNIELAANRKDSIAIEKMAYACYMAGLGFSNIGLGITNAMANSLSIFFDLPQSLVTSIMLPYVLEFNGSICPELFKNMAKALGIDTISLDDNQVVNKVVELVKKLLVSLGIPQTLKEIGIPEETLPMIAKQAYNDIYTNDNPREVNEQEILDLYKKAY